MKMNKFQIDLDLPGDGQFYCIECQRYFIDDRTLQLHKKTKVILKKKIANLQIYPFTKNENFVIFLNSLLLLICTFFLINSMWKRRNEGEDENYKHFNFFFSCTKTAWKRWKKCRTRSKKQRRPVVWAPIRKSPTKIESFRVNFETYLKTFILTKNSMFLILESDLKWLWDRC